MNYLQLRERVARKVGLARSAADSAEEWDLIGETVNEGVVDILSRTRLNVRCLDLTLDADDQEYVIDDRILKLYDLRRADGTLLEEGARGDLDRVDDANTFIIIGFNRIRVGFTPTASDLTMKAWYTPLPTTMTDDAHDPSDATYGAIPVQFHPAIVEYSAWHLADAARDDGSARGERYRVKYEGKGGHGDPGSWIARIRSDTNLRGGSGSRTGRLRRSRDILLADTNPNAWVG